MKRFFFFILLLGLISSNSLAQIIALGPGLNIVVPQNDSLNLGTMWGIQFNGKVFDSATPWAFGVNFSYAGKRLDEINKFQVYQAGLEVDYFLKKGKLRPYVGAEVGVLANYRDDFSIPLTTFYLDLNPKLGFVIPLSNNTWLDLNAGIGYGRNDGGEFIYVPVGIGLIYDAIR